MAAKQKTTDETAKEQKVLLVGKVLAVLPGTEYKVEFKFQGVTHELIGYISGRMRRNYIKILENDQVVIEISPEYDQELTSARVVYKIDRRRMALPPFLEGKVINWDK